MRDWSEAEIAIGSNRPIAAGGDSQKGPPPFNMRINPRKFALDSHQRCLAIDDKQLFRLI